jgi:hypothetical protein
MGNCQGRKVGWVWEVGDGDGYAVLYRRRLDYAPGRTGTLGLATLRVGLLTTAAEDLGPLRHGSRRWKY